MEGRGDAVTGGELETVWNRVQRILGSVCDWAGIESSLVVGLQALVSNGLLERGSSWHGVPSAFLRYSRFLWSVIT